MWRTYIHFAGKEEEGEAETKVQELHRGQERQGEV